MYSYLDLPRPAIFAHRGASAYAPENTIAAFELAIRQGCDGIELDVMLTQDRQAVVTHDHNLQRITGFHGHVSELTLANIQKMDAGSFFDAEYTNERIPSLDEVFQIIGSRAFINVELKNYHALTDSLPEVVARLVLKYKLHSNLLFSSFNPIALRKIKKLLPQIPTALLALPGKDGWWARNWIGKLLTRYNALHPELQDATPGLVNKQHNTGKRIHVYTVNNPLDMERLYDIGVDGIFTDDPLLARNVLTYFQNQKSSITHSSY
jgi:glycerophosphoryl diester phosphodiesterase